MTEASETLGDVKKGLRGFELIEFTDLYGYACSLQQSSMAKHEPPGCSAVWLGCDDNHVHSMTGETLSPRMHLSVEQVKALVSHLQLWLDNGSFQ